MRYGIPAAWALFTGAGLSVLLLNVLFRIGVQGDVERDREDEARSYFAEHGRWPDEEERPAGRRWRLPEGVATPETEAADARVHTPEGSNSRMR